MDVVLNLFHLRFSKLLLILNYYQRPPLEAYLCQRMVSVRQINPQAMSYGFKIYTLAKKAATVTQQLTKSIDFRRNYLCDTSISEPLSTILLFAQNPIADVNSCHRL
jgi:hypothetical protein